MKNNKFIEISGWLGMLMIITAYGFVSFSFLKAESFSYQFLNIGGALGILLNAFWHKAYPSFALNAAWFLIAAVSIFKLFFK